MVYVGIGLVELYPHPLASYHLLGESGCLSAKVFNGLLRVFCLRCVHTDQADPLPGTNNYRISINNPGN